MWENLLVVCETETPEGFTFVSSGRKSIRGEVAEALTYRILTYRFAYGQRGRKQAGVHSPAELPACLAEVPYFKIISNHFLLPL